jgi:uncharacterized protein (AIM24 family)
MKLFIAVVAKLVQSLVTIAGLMAFLFLGYLLFTHAGPRVSSFVGASAHLEQVRHELQENEAAIAAREAEVEAQQRLMASLEEQIARQQALVLEELERDVEALKRRAEEHKSHVVETVEQNRSRAARAMQEAEGRYCSSYNPLDWLTCREIRRRKQGLEESVELQREALTQAARRLEEHATAQAEQLKEEAEQILAARTAEMRSSLEETLERLEQAELDRQFLEDRLEALRDEEASIYGQHWIVLELEERWPGLLLMALLIFFAPFIRRTFWYFVGMPIAARAAPIELTEPGRSGQLATSTAERTIAVELAPKTRLMARPGYIQSDKAGARTDILFDWKTPNLSYISGLVLLTRLQADETPREVLLGSPDDPDAYLMEIRLEDHPGIVLKARNVVAVKGDIGVMSSWRLRSWHAWATQQVRFLVFSGTGSIIVEGYGDVGALEVSGVPCEKRMPLVIGFDARLRYSTRRAATFLPYLLAPEREPLVVDVFEGQGSFFYQKNPTTGARRSGTERAGDFFFDALRRLLGL